MFRNLKKLAASCITILRIKDCLRAKDITINYPLKKAALNQRCQKLCL